VVLVALAWIAWTHAPLPRVAGVAWLGGALLGLCGFLLMTLTVQYGVSRMPVHRSAVILLFELVVGAVSSLLLTTESVQPREWAGGAMIVTAAWLAARIHAREGA
jgi:drug/metabolite transporter (DMT)-like permease